MNNKTAVVAGSTGLIGAECIRQLITNPNYKKVIAISRKPLAFQHEKLENIVLDFEELPNKASLLQADDYFCCLGTTIKIAGSQENFRKVDETYVLALAKVAEQANAKSFCVVSAMGANESSGIFYNSVKGKMENELKKMNIPYIGIFRPSLLLGDRKETRIGETIGEYFLAFFKVISLGLAKNLYAIKGEKVAKAMIEHANSGKKGVEVVLSGEMNG